MLLERWRTQDNSLFNINKVFKNYKGNNLKHLLSKLSNVLIIVITCVHFFFFVVLSKPCWKKCTI